MSNVFNFSAGPAMFPREVLEQAQAEILNWNGLGMSVMEISHRSHEFMQMTERAEITLRSLLSIPDNYHVLFVAGGATTQFSMVPLNLMGTTKTADYIDTGEWSQRAIKEAARYGTVNVAARVDKKKSLAEHNNIQIPKIEEWQLNPNAAYVHYTPNETIDGIEFHSIPETGDVPLVADMSSTILSRSIDVSRFGIIYAGAQKNIGPSGLTLVIIRHDLLAREPIPTTPVLYNYRINHENKSFYNTPPTYSWYLAGLVFEWLKRQGGLAVMAERNQRKSAKLYDFIDTHDFYRNNVHTSCRSWMNIPFTLQNSELDKLFISQANAAGLTNLKGHRIVGGMRASIYNAMPEAGVDALIDFMRDFARQHG